jgi:Abnormal spindle-like microcephaly-assoc'd, ASPM-SPD-2-Hydin
MRLKFDRSRYCAQLLTLRGWCIRALIFTCCLPFVLSNCSYAANKPAVGLLRPSLSAVEIEGAPPRQFESRSGFGAAPGRADLSVSAISLRFGDVALGSTRTFPVTVTAIGASPIAIITATIAGSGFSVSGATFPLVLNPRQSATIDVQAGALRIGAAIGTLTLLSDSPRTPRIAVFLSSTGVARISTQLRVSTTSLNFGKVTVGSTATLPVMVTSIGTAPLTITSSEISGVGYIVSGATLPLTLHPGETLNLNVTAAPRIPSTSVGTLMINSNALRHSGIAVSLTAIGIARTSPQLKASPASVNFGDVMVGSNVTLPVTLTSTGLAPMMIGLPKVIGAGFTVSGATFPMELKPQKKVMLFITFAPTTVSAESGFVTFSSTAMRHNGITVSMLSRGIPRANPQLGLSQSRLNFGTVHDGSTATLPITLTSTGTSALTINSAKISGAGFSFSGGAFPVTLNPQLGVTLNVKFNPAGIATNGTLMINSDSSTDGTAVVTLSGDGQYVVDLSWEAPSTSPDPIAGYNVYRTPGITSPGIQVLNSSPDRQTTYVDNTVESGATYDYFVKSVDASGAESAPSKLVSVTIPSGSALP